MYPDFLQPLMYLLHEVLLFAKLTIMKLEKSYLVSVSYYTNPAYVMQNVIGGDQLTASRIRGSKRVRKNSYSTLQHLQAFIPCVEDWHARVCLLGVRNAVLACTPFHYQASGATATSSSLICVSYMLITQSLLHHHKHISFISQNLYIVFLFLNSETELSKML